jgi:hypothetical protein
MVVNPLRAPSTNCERALSHKGRALVRLRRMPPVFSRTLPRDCCRAPPGKESPRRSPREKRGFKEKKQWNFVY